MNPTGLGFAAGLVLGVVWIKHVARSFRSDLQQLLGDSEGTEKASILALWALTAGVIWWLFSALTGLGG